jgi:hypothetical protein
MKILGSGIDTLVLAVNIKWKDKSLFEVLGEMKEKAKEENADRPGIMRGKTNEDDWIFGLRPFGSRGYEWILTGKEMTMRIGNYLEPITMPSVMIEIGSEAFQHLRQKEF